MKKLTPRQAWDLLSEKRKIHPLQQLLKNLRLGENLLIEEEDWAVLGYKKTPVSVRQTIYEFGKKVKKKFTVMRLGSQYLIKVKPRLP